MAKLYEISLSEKLSKAVGKDVLYMEGDNPPKAVKAAFEKLGYKVHLRRFHDYSFRPGPADVETKLSTKSGVVYHAYYTITVMIKTSA